MLLTATKQKEQVAEYVAEGNTAQFGDPRWAEELKSWLRFNTRDAMRTGDGLLPPSASAIAGPISSFASVAGRRCRARRVGLWSKCLFEHDRGCYARTCSQPANADCRPRAPLVPARAPDFIRGSSGCAPAGSVSAAAADVRSVRRQLDSTADQHRYTGG